ncbi:MAG: deoxyribodipyrimidine photolyase [Desulfovibrionaceae bacterium CG1_02_65_16]|nr:MAG: deoxyribodipyrimidine photolyase [Desulfovibrionaceae bacterium CG1_02_65_16]
MRPDREQIIRALFDQYIEMYASRDGRLTGRFSENFSGFAGGGDQLVKGRAEWIKVTRHDFAQVPERIRIEMLDLCMQDISDAVVMTTAFFHIHLPFNDAILSTETARLVLVFRREAEDWKIVSSTISIPYRLVQNGEVYPLRSLYERNRELEELVEVRTRALEKTNAKLKAMSNTDALTNIANRRSFNHMLEQEWNRALRAARPLALIMLDVDHFKHYNDHYGHVAGDDCLKALGQALVKAERRAGRLVARYGGEEFVILMPETTETEALAAAERLQKEIWALALPHAETVPGIVTVSLGAVSVVPTMEHMPDFLLRQADAALYRAKSLGRNQVQMTEG